MKKGNVIKAIAIILATTAISTTMFLPLTALAQWTRTAVNTGNIIQIGKKQEYVWSQQAQDLALAGIDGYTVDGKAETNPINLIERLGVENLTAAFTPTGGETIAVSDVTEFTPTTAGELTVYPNKAWYTNEPLTVPIRVSQAFSVKFQVQYPAWYQGTTDVLKVNVTDAESITSNLTAVKENDAYKIVLPSGEYDFSLSSLCFRANATNENVEFQDVTIESAITKVVKFSVPKLNTMAAVTYNDSGFEIAKGNNTCSALMGAGVPNSDGTPSQYKYVTANANEGFVVSYKVQANVAQNSSAWWSDGGFCFKIGASWYTLMVHTSQGAEGSARIAFSKQADGQFTNIFYANTGVQLKKGTEEAREIEIAFNPADVILNDKSYGAFYIRIKGVTESAVRIGPEFFDENRAGEKSSSNLSVWMVDAQRSIFKNGVDSNGKAFGTFTIDEYFASAQRILGFRSIDAANVFTDVEYRLGTEYAQARIKAMRKIADASDRQISEKDPWPDWSVE